MIPHSEPIAVRVGVAADQRTWHVPKKVLTTNSTFFATLLYGDFAEKDAKTVTLSEVHSENFQVWVKWLRLGEDYLNKIHTCRSSSHEEEVRFWNFGDMLGCPKFQDVAVTFLARCMSKYCMHRHLLAFIWDACAPGSKLRTFAVDQCVIDVRMGRFGPATEEEIIRFAEEHEDFARAYVVASIAKAARPA